MFVVGPILIGQEQHKDAKRRASRIIGRVRAVFVVKEIDRRRICTRGQVQPVKASAAIVEKGTASM